VFKKWKAKHSEPDCTIYSKHQRQQIVDEDIFRCFSFHKVKALYK